jgi:hypothetical protein
LVELADLSKKKKNKNDRILKKPHQILNKHLKTKQKQILSLSYQCSITLFYLMKYELIGGTNYFCFIPFILRLQERRQ